MAGGTKYTPGSLSMLLESESNAAPTTGSRNKLQALFSTPSVPQKVQSSAIKQQLKSPVVSNAEKASTSRSKLASAVHATDSDLVIRREESVSSVDTFQSTKKRKRQKKSKEAATSQSTENASSSTNLHVNEEAIKMMNAENAVRRLKIAHGKPERDTSLDSRTVFVGNVSLTVGKKALFRLFMSCGKVQSVRLRSVPVADLKLPLRANVIKKRFHPSRHTSNAYVVFETPSAAEKALSLNDTELDGLHIRVDLAATGKQHDHSKSVFVGNLPYDVEEEDLREHFTDCGNVKDVRIVRDQKTRVGKGFGYILFEDSASVSLALSLNNQPFKGRALRIQRSSEKPDRSSAKSKSKAAPKFTKKSKKVKIDDKHANESSSAADAATKKPPKKPKIKKKKSSEQNSQSWRKTDLQFSVHRKKRKEKQKKKIKRRAVEKKKESLGRLLTK